MKKLIRNLLVVSFLSVGLVSCGDEVLAEPGNIDSPIVNITDSEKDYFRNTIEYLYTDLIDGGTTNTTVFNNLVTNIAEAELEGFVSEEKIKKLCKEELLKKVTSGSFSTNNLFNEEKFANSLNTALTIVTPGTNGYNKDYLITPEDHDVENFDNVFYGNYDKYIEKEIRPTVLKNLLTSKYLYENSVSSLSRASAREVSYIKLENFANKAGEVNKLINEWLGKFITAQETDKTLVIDLDELQAIYKGVKQEGTDERSVRINDYIDRYYTLADEIEEDIEKIATIDNGKYVMKDADDTDKTIEDKYTGNGAYTIEWGHELALRTLAQKDFTGSDIYTKSTGISDLPSSLTDNRIFSPSISSYLTGEKTDGTRFLKPVTTLNGSSLGNYYHYDSSSNAYYIIVVSNYYTSSVINNAIENDTNKEELIDIAYDLSTSSTNQRQALVHYLQNYNVGSNIHDETFYDYIVDNYSEVIDD